MRRAIAALFALSAAGYAWFAGTLAATGHEAMSYSLAAQVTSSPLAPLIWLLTGLAVLAAGCAVVLFFAREPSRRTTGGVLALCIAATAVVVIAGWSTLFIPLAVPAVVLSFVGRKALAPN